jgi:TonB-dependent starch-binding outer membrane protein SusC
MKGFLWVIVASFMFCGFAYGQRSITGMVADNQGEPLIGATVYPKGNAAMGTITDLDGKFAVTLPAGADVLVISYTGYTTRELTVGSSNVLNVTLEQGTILDEVVFVGYGQKAERFNTQAVSSIGEAGIALRPVFSPQELLQGQAAGVQMVTSSGVLGAQSSVRIRGASSITGGGQPLWVVDGVPMNDNIMSGAQGGGTGLNPLMNINPNDIESISVLKDAAAAAIYGSRGSNGVIIVTTKKGRSDGKTVISLDMQTGVSSPTNLLEMMNTDQFSGFVNDYRTSRGLAPQEFPTDYFDWVDGVVQQGKFNNVNLSVSGGNQATSYFIGGSFRDESAFTIGNDATTLSGRINLQHRANDWLTVGTNLSISSIDMDRIGVENNTFAPLTSSYLQLPFVLPRNEDGTFRNTGFIQNVLGIEELNTNQFISSRTTGNVYADFKLAEGLTFRTDWGIDQYGTSEKTRGVNLFTPGGSAFRQLINDNKWLTTNTLDYLKLMDNNSSFNVLAGYSFETSRFETVAVASRDFATDDLPNVSSGSTPTITDETGTEWALESQFLRANYNHLGKYVIEGTVRRDGSSRFGSNFRYGTFWAASAGWILSEESFMANQSFFDFLKLTASYGTSGNDRIGNFSSLGLFGGGVLADYGGAAGLRPIQVPNPNLTWEETTQFDVGISALFAKERVKMNLNFYNKETNGLLLNVPYPFTTGFGSASQNVGRIQNQGIDLDLNVTLMRKKDFNWTFGLNVGYLQNTVLELPDASVDDDGNRFVQGSAAQRAVEGRSLNEFFMVRALGVNPSTGDFEWLDKEGNPTTTYSAANRVFVGSAIPDWVGGFNTRLDYKGFDLNLLFNFSVGNMVLIDGLRFTDNIASPGFNKSTDLLNYWQQEGDQAFAPNLASTTANLFNQPSTAQLQNGSFLRLRNLTLGYTIPESALGGQNVLQGARVFVQGQNLFLVKHSDFRGPDPEVSANGASNLVQGESFFALPQARIITFGLSAKF